MFLKRFGHFLLSILCPPTCPICAESVDEVHCLCPACYSKLNFITQPCCDICGKPFEYAIFDELTCGACLKQKTHFSMARSVLAYDDFSKKLVLAFKHGDHTELNMLFLKFLVQADKAVFQNVDMIIPVPLHWTRRLKRKYNQAGLLGKVVGRYFTYLLYRPFYPELNERKVRDTKSEKSGKRISKMLFVLKIPLSLKVKPFL